ncbi:MAG: restriction endonuclease subunit S [Flavobacteriaceae bacterium]|jgi:hypothetical protein|nr:restriction endonuclease subunit S [Flavobacteriaceae bacterium]
MQKELQQLEKKHGIGWREFEIGELFEIQNTLSFNKDKLTVGDEYDYVTRTSQNQGILQATGFVNEENINSAETWSLGLLQMDFFYRRKPWYAGQFVRKIIPKIKLSKSAVQYFTVLLNKQKNILLQGLVRDVDNAFLTAKITLPTINEKIAFSYIEEFFATLDAERLATLDAYLLSTNLKDYQLTEEEKTALEKLEKVEWREFNLENLFGKSTRGRRLKSADRTEGNLPFVTAGEKDTGISAFIGNKVQIFSENTTTIDMFGSAKYRNYRYGADDHVAVVHTETLDKFAAIFTTSCINKSSHAGQFDYSRNFYATDADELNISLPVNPDHTPDSGFDKGFKPLADCIDFDFMATYIQAMQKIVIKNVVEWADKRIAKTMEIVACG